MAGVTWKFCKEPDKLKCRSCRTGNNIEPIPTWPMYVLLPYCLVEFGFSRSRTGAQLNGRCRLPAHAQVHCQSPGNLSGADL